MQIHKKIMLCVIMLLAVFPLMAQEVITPTAPTRILFILDASNSMNQHWNDVIKIDAAKSIISDLVNELKEAKNVEIALRVYGMQSPFMQEDCKDTKLLLPFDKPDIANFKRVLYSIKPNGVTPIAYSLENCAGDFPTSAGRNIIILVTDGIESCHGDPCAISLALQRKGIFLKPFIIGLDIKNESTAGMECVGTYFNAPDAQAFKRVLHSIVQTALSTTYVQVNLDDITHKPTETDAVMAFSDTTTNTTRYNYYHTFNYRGESDTVSIDPVNSYNLTIYTTPLTEHKSLNVTPNKNNIVNVDVPQGYLSIEFQGQVPNEYILQKISGLVRVKTDDLPVCVIPYGNIQKMLCGNYALEVLTIPRTYISNVNIAESKTTTIKLPMPGVVSIQKNTTGYGSIFVADGTGLKKVYDLQSDATIENVALQPGNYKIIYRAVNNRSMNQSVEKKFTVATGQNVNIQM